MRTDAEALKDLYERLDTVWSALNVDPEVGDDFGNDWEVTRQEFLALLDNLARGAQSSEMWALVGRWAGEKA
jgi:hypothetical protein